MYDLQCIEARSFKHLQHSYQHQHGSSPMAHAPKSPSSGASTSSPAEFGDSSTSFFSNNDDDKGTLTESMLHGKVFFKSTRNRAVSQNHQLQGPSNKLWLPSQFRVIKENLYAISVLLAQSQCSSGLLKLLDEMSLVKPKTKQNGSKKSNNKKNKPQSSSTASLMNNDAITVDLVQQTSGKSLHRAQLKGATSSSSNVLEICSAPSVKHFQISRQCDMIKVDLNVKFRVVSSKLNDMVKLRVSLKGHDESGAAPLVIDSEPFGIVARLITQCKTEYNKKRRKSNSNGSKKCSASKRSRSNNSSYDSLVDQDDNSDDEDYQDSSNSASPCTVDDIRHNSAAVKVISPVCDAPPSVKRIKITQTSSPTSAPSPTMLKSNCFNSVPTIVQQQPHQVVQSSSAALLSPVSSAPMQQSQQEQNQQLQMNHHNHYSKQQYYCNNGPVPATSMFNADPHHQQHFPIHPTADLSSLMNTISSGSVLPLQGISSSHTLGQDDEMFSWLVEVMNMSASSATSATQQQQLGSFITPFSSSSHHGGQSWFQYSNGVQNHGHQSQDFTAYHNGYYNASAPLGQNGLFQ